MTLLICIHSNVILIFYWSAYNKNEEKQIYNENVMEVVKLIEEYGKTFTNQDHGSKFTNQATT
ncbi:MAG: hypothetical protein ACLT8L_01640 [Streptococcus salivarius]